MSSVTQTIIEGLNKSNNICDPLGWAWHRSSKASVWVQKHPIATRVFIVPLAAIVGFSKPFTLPVFAIAGLVMIPAQVLFAKLNGYSPEYGKNLTAWVFCVIAIGGVMSFMAVSAFHMTLLQGTAVVVTGCSLSIIIHVYRVLRSRQETLTTSMP